MPLENVKPGMTGEGYSVFLGTKIQRFNVKILSIVDGNSGHDKLILVRLTGKPLTASGGLAAGMSGSPVYIGQKLIGAISYGFENADNFLALVTPIERMLKLYPPGEPITALSQLPIKPIPLTPVLISGMGNRSFEMVSKALEPYGLRAISVPQSLGGSLPKGDTSSLQPGSAIAVQMVSGDYQVSAIGTVTLIDHNNFLAFGHAFTNKGKVDFAAYQAYIFHTVKSPVMSFKIGAPLKPIGRITQDRQAGILGRIGESPNLLPVLVKVDDLDAKTSRECHFQVSNNEQIYRDLITAGVTDAIDQTIDRVGSGTARVVIKISVAERNEPLVYENLFYGKDIAVSCLKDLRNILDLLAGNELNALNLRELEIGVEIQNNQATARIIKLEPERLSLKPGETLKLNLLVRAYRGESFRVPFEVKLPDNIAPGKLVITARGGFKTANGTEDESHKKNDALIIDYKDVDSLNDLIIEIGKAPKNNELVLEYTIYNDPKRLGSTNDAAEDEGKPVELKAATKYVILGEDQATIEIVQP